MPQIAKVAVSAANYAIDKPYDYLLPDGTDAAVGSRVLVPFGRGNRLTEGMILSLERKTPEKALKAVREVLEPEPVCSEREIRLALWMRQRYFCTFYDAIRTILPAGVWYRYRQFWKLADYAGEDALSEKEKPLYALLSRGEQELETLAQAVPDAAALLRQMEKKGLVTSRTEGSRRVGDRVVKLASLAIEPEEAQTRMERKRRTAPRQCDAVDFLTRCAETSVHDLCYFTGVTAAGLRSLEKAGIIALRAREEYRIAPRTALRAAEPIRLNDEQQAAFLRMLAECRAGEAGVTLLQGVTGSGKTLVYIRLAQELLREGKSVMILVPEIALTPQMMARFTAYFGAEVALLHSGLRLTERYDQYKRIRRGEAHIVLGTRSAVFAPLRELGLIVLDEEQESSYESGSAPFYHARDIAKYRCAQEGARLLLGSATPTVETAYFARHGEYELLRLDRRFNAHRLPRVVVADLSLYVDHYRASERTFSLITQVVGRAGRGSKEGRAVIQTYTPENDVILAAAGQDYDRFYDAEIRMRRLRRDPPFADQFMITVTGPEETRVRRACGEIQKSLCAAAARPPYSALGLEILGPAPCPVVKVNNRFRYRVTVIGKNERTLRALIAAFMKEFTKRPENRGMHIFTDCNLMG